jgi:hypothetical protein
MDEADGRPGILATQFGQPDAPTDAPDPSLRLLIPDSKLQIKQFHKARVLGYESSDASRFIRSFQRTRSQHQGAKS